MLTEAQKKHTRRARKRAARSEANVVVHTLPSPSPSLSSSPFSSSSSSASASSCSRSSSVTPASLLLDTIKTNSSVCLPTVEFACEVYWHGEVVNRRYRTLNDEPDLTKSDLTSTLEREHLEGSLLIRRKALSCIDANGNIQLELLQRALKKHGSQVLSFLPTPRLQAFLRAVKSSGVRLPPEVQLVIDENIAACEDIARREALFNNQSHFPSLLTSVYAAHGKRAWQTSPHPALKRRVLTLEERRHPHLTPQALSPDRHPSPSPGTPSVVTSLMRFELNLDAFSRGMLRGVDLTKVVLAGGAVTACLLPLPNSLTKLHEDREKALQALDTYLPLAEELRELVSDFCGFETGLWDLLASRYSEVDAPFWNSDLDLFLIVDNEEEGQVAIRKCLEEVKKNVPTAQMLLRTYNSFTLVTGYPYRHVQVVVLLHKSIDELLLFGDLDCTAFVYTAKAGGSRLNGRGQVFTHPRGIRALNTCYNFVEPHVLAREHAAQRLRKYCERGFGSILFEFCNHNPRCDIEVSNDMVAKFCKIEQDIRSGSEPPIRYNSTSEIPYGPGVMKIEYFLQSQQRTIRAMFQNGFRSMEHETFAAPWTITDLDRMFEPFPETERDSSNERLLAVKPLCWRKLDVLNSQEGAHYSGQSSQNPKCYQPKTYDDWKMSGVAPPYWPVLQLLEQEWGQVKGLFIHGSSLYSNKPPADVDLLAIVDFPKRVFVPNTPAGQFKMGKYEVSVFPREFWIQSLKEMDLTMIVTLSYPPRFIVVPFHHPDLASFAVGGRDGFQLAQRANAYADYTWAKALRLMESDLHKAAKNVYFALRIVNIALQLLKFSTVRDFTAANHWWDEVERSFATENFQLGDANRLVEVWGPKVTNEKKLILNQG